MNRLWLWLACVGALLIVLGTLGWLSGRSEWWYILLGVSVLLSGLGVRRRRGRCPSPFRQSVRRAHVALLPRTGGETPPQNRHCHLPLP